MTPLDSIATLTAAFGDRSLPDRVEADGRPAAVLSWPAVPIELVRAAGFRPIVMRGGAEPTPLADAHLEPNLFPGRIRRLVDAVLAGRLSDAVVVLPRTSTADYQCFLYLRELVRRGAAPMPRAILLFDLLQSNGARVAAHNADRARALFEALAAVSGRASLDALREQIAAANAARAAMRQLLRLRGPVPRITGAEAMPLIGAFWQLAADAYAELATSAAETIARRPVVEGPRVLLLGAPVDDCALHAAVETLGAVVVGECGPWGAHGAGGDVPVGPDPFTAVADKYRRDSWGARTPLADVRSWTAAALTDVDAVLISLPPDDAVFGWDYPWLRDRLNERGVPHVCVTHEPSLPLAGAERERLASMIRGARPRVEARRG